MPIETESRIPETLSELLSMHSGYDDLIKGGKGMSCLGRWKKRKLLIRDLLSSHSIADDRGPTITMGTLNPLSVDTLKLLEAKISSELAALRAEAGPTSTKLVELQNLHARVEVRLQQKLGGLKQAA